MKFKSWTEERELELRDCPFCGSSELKVEHIGNELSKRRTIRIKCRNCRIERTDSTLRHDFTWLENVTVENWNRRRLAKIDFDIGENYDAFVEYLSKERACFQAIFFSDFMEALKRNCHKLHDDQIGFMARYFEDAGIYLIKKLYENIEK